MTYETVIDTLAYGGDDLHAHAPIFMQVPTMAIHKDFSIGIIWTEVFSFFMTPCIKCGVCSTITIFFFVCVFHGHRWVTNSHRRGISLPYPCLRKVQLCYQGCNNNCSKCKDTKYYLLVKTIQLHIKLWKHCRHSSSKLILMCHYHL